MTDQEAILRLKFSIPLHQDITKMAAIDVPLELVQCIVEDNFDKVRRECKQRKVRK